MSEMSVTNEVSQQFLRRTPVKLRQFARLLQDLSSQKIEPLRLKALLSQVKKTHEACENQGFDSTAKLLHKLIKQLSMSDEALKSQGPLLNRFSIKLSQHSQTLELGSAPKAKNDTDNQAQVQAKVESKSHSQVEDKVTKAETESGKPPATKSQPGKTETSVQQQAEKSATETVVADTDESEEVADTLHSLEKYALYLTGNIIIFVSHSPDEYKIMGEQFESLGIEVLHMDNLQQAKQHSAKTPGSVIVASIEFAELNQQLKDEDIETARTPVFYVCEKDTQADRLLALRSGGTGFLVEPVNLTSLLELIEIQYDIHAESPYRILVMEDSRAQAKYYEKVLSKGHFDIRIVNDPAVLLEALRGFDPEVVLMDMQMPGCTGIELTRIIRQMPRYAFLPIIFLSAEENERKQNQALSSGGTGFIVKPVQKEQLMFNAELYARRYRVLHPQIGINSDTGLAFASYFKQQVSIEAIRMTRSNGNAALAIIQLDSVDKLVDKANFLLINQVIQQLALLLKKRLRKTDIIGHVDTGQLGVILTSGSKNDWLSVMRQIKTQFAELAFQKQQSEPLSISTGISLLPANADAHQWFTTTYNHLTAAISDGGDEIRCCDALKS